MSADLVPLALAVAASPFPVIPAILLLLTPRATANAGAFLAGWAAGILVGTSATVLLASVLEGFDEPPRWVAWARIVVGAALVVLGVRQWLSRGDQREAPGWMRSLASATPGSAGRLGVLLSLANPKILLLSVAAGVSIAGADTSTTVTVLSVVGFTLLGSVSVALPLLAHLTLGDRATAPLERAQAWLVEHNATVMAVVILVIGGMLLGEGLGGL